MSYGTVGPPWWDEVWIVAGGPSAREFDIVGLSGKAVLAVNSGIFLFRPELAGNHAMFSADPCWTRQFRHVLAEHPTYRGEKYVTLALDTHPDLADIPGVTYLQRSHEAGLSDDPQFLCTGGNSGYAAINLAYLKRAPEIHLVGFDMDPSQDQKFREWIPRFRDMLPQLRAKGVRVVNHNPRSFIDAFPLCD